MSLREEDMKEAMEFMTRFGGSVASVGEQMFFDWIYSAYPELRSNPLFQRPSLDLPQYSDFLVGGLNVAAWAVGLLVEEDAEKKGDKNMKDAAKIIRELGEGGVLYTVPRITRIAAVNTISKAIKPSAQSQPPAGQHNEPPAARGIVYQL